LEFHSHARDMVSLTTKSTIDAYSIEKNEAIFSIETKEAMEQHCWAPFSGSILLGHSTSNVLRTYDPRASSRAQLEIAGQSNRLLTSTFLDDTTILSTGLHKYSPTNHRKRPVDNDTNTSPV
jgi:hypothetical protein